MARFTDDFLADLRAALPVSTVAARHMTLKKAGTEWKALSPFQTEKTPSFTVNDRKQMWHDFSSGRTGNVFQLEMEITGCTFGQAVERCAELAGMSLPKDDGRRPNGAANHQPEPPPHDAPQRADADDSQRRITAVYEYRDADGAVIYQDAKVEWLERGARKKNVFPRRQIPGTDGWIWGLKGGVYVRSARGDWYQADGRDDWHGERRTFDDTAPMLYRLPELLEETAQESGERRVVWIPEGAKDADTLAAWGLVATTCSGGTGGWKPHFAGYFAGCDVVIPIDNDAAGRKFGHAKAMALRGIAARVRVLDLKAHWPVMPDKADVTDWRDFGGGTTARLWSIIDQVPDWTPQPPESSFNALRFADLDRPARELEWLVKKVLTRGEVSIWYGEPGCGKSFLVTDAAMSIARGVSWMGLRTRPGLVVYQAGEGGLGLKRRLRAYRKHYQMQRDDNVPFVLLPWRINLFADNADVDKLIAEIKSWASYYDVPLELVVIDTLSAATPGANENNSEDMTKVLERCRRISAECACHVALVHHTPKAGGSPRGWSGLSGNVENMVMVERTDQVAEETAADGHRILRDTRLFTVTKQKDAEDRLTRAFVLKQVVLGVDEEGDRITSCVVADIAPPAEASKVVPVGWAQIHGQSLDVFRALIRALRKNGRTAPAGAEVSREELCVTIGEWQAELVEMSLGHEVDSETLRARIKKRVQRACAHWESDTGPKLVGKSREWVWRTGRKVHHADEPPRPPTKRPYDARADGPPDQPDMLLAQGEDPRDAAATLN